MGATPFKLKQDEQIIFKLRTHPKVLFGRIIASLLLLALAIAYWVNLADEMPIGVNWGVMVFLFVVGLWYGIWPMLQWWFNIFLVTNKQIVVFKGVIFKDSHHSQITRISDIGVERGLIDRFFGCGTIVLYNAAGNVQEDSVGGSPTRVTLKDVPHVNDVREQIADIIIT